MSVSTLAGPPWRLLLSVQRGTGQDGQGPSHLVWCGCVWTELSCLVEGDAYPRLEEGGSCQLGPAGQPPPSLSCGQAPSHPRTSSVAKTCTRWDWPPPPGRGWPWMLDQNQTPTLFRHFYHNIEIEHIGQIKLKFYYLLVTSAFTTGRAQGLDRDPT